MSGTTSWWRENLGRAVTKCSNSSAVILVRSGSGVQIRDDVNTLYEGVPGEVEVPDRRHRLHRMRVLRHQCVQVLQAGCGCDVAEVEAGVSVAVDGESDEAREVTLPSGRVDRVDVPAQLDVLQRGIGFQQVAHVEQRDLADNREVELLDIGRRTLLLPNLASRADVEVTHGGRDYLDGGQFESNNCLLGAA